MAKTDLAKIEEQLAAENATVRTMIGKPDGNKIYIDNETGNFMAPGGMNLGNELSVVVVDFCTAHRYYPGAYNRNQIVPPVCFAFGDVIADMRPEDEAPEPQSEACATCPKNEWGSAGIAGSNAKACKNTRELAIVLADDLEDPDLDPELFVISCSPSSIKSFDAFVSAASRLYNGPPIKALVTIRTVRVENYWTIQFASPEPNPHLLRVFPLRDHTADLLARTPDLTNYIPSDQQGRAKPAPVNRPAVRKR